MTTTTTTTTTTTMMSMMKAVQVFQFITDFENLRSEDLTLSETVPKPQVDNANQMLVKVLACSISPGDLLMMRGNLVFLHPKIFPYIPGMDICGIVEDSNGSDQFQKGDVIVASNGTTPVNGLAEYMVIDKKEAVLKPTGVSIMEAAACSSAITARNAVMDYVKPGHRVLILGGSGGVGSAAIQICKQQIPDCVVTTTSTQIEYCKSLGADQVIDYRTENWWERQWEQPLDVIIDTIGGNNHFEKAQRVLKTKSQGGMFVAVAGDDPIPDANTLWKALKFVLSLPWRPLKTWWYSTTMPGYTLLMPYDFPQGRTQVLDWMNTKSLKISLDTRGPFPFTQQGIHQAFQVVASKHAHGKVVIEIASIPQPQQEPNNEMKEKEDNATQ